MKVQELKKGEVLHKQGQKVETIEIISKGTIRISNEYSSLDLTGGQICGLSETPGKDFLFSYEALSDATIISYPYQSQNDLVDMFKSNPKILPILSSNVVKTCIAFYNSCEQQFNDAKKQFQTLKDDYEKYPILCAKVGVPAQVFPEVMVASPIAPIEFAPSWIIDALKAMMNNDQTLRTNLYTLNADIDIFIIMMAIRYIVSMTEHSQTITNYRKELSRQTSAFQNAFHIASAKSDTIEQGNSSDSSMDVPEFKNVCKTILAYADLDEELKTEFSNAVYAYKTSSNQDVYSDEYRRIRRDLSTYFYKVYAEVLIKSLEDSIVPDAISMFLTFGYTDEDLVSPEVTAKLYRFMKSYVPDPYRRVFTIREWLTMIYNNEVVPSRNEFNLDYPAYLKEQQTQGNLTEKEVKEFLNDSKAKVVFEVTNLFSMGNRVTFGRASAFIPIFDEVNITKALEDAYLQAPMLNSTIDEIRKLDYSLFCREVLFSDQKLGINQFLYQKEVLPKFILLPNVGSQAYMWQEIEGKKRDTPARFVISIFHTEDLQSSLIKVFGDYRWEMCKTVQGIYWNDITDPSLTADYCDYLQFYKKNRLLNETQKEKLYQQLKKHSNRFKNVFIEDYQVYMKFEINGSLRLNKVSRTALFKYCTFDVGTRQKLLANPQYKELIDKFNLKINTDLHALENIETKIERSGNIMPEEVLLQRAFLEK